MSHKTLKILYWITTGLFALFLLADGIAGVAHVPAGEQSILTLSYPLYLLNIIGWAKIAAAFAIIQTRFRLIKEWAFAGYAVDCYGAAASWYFVGGHTMDVILAVVFFLLSLIPYYFWKKTQ